MRILILIAISLAFYGCKKEPKTYTFDFDNVRVRSVGNTSAGYCGYVLIGGSTSNGNYNIYKPIELPDSLKKPNVRFRMKLETLPYGCECMDGSVDPKPGEPAPTLTMHRVKILSASKF